MTKKIILISFLTIIIITFSFFVMGLLKSGKNDMSQQKQDKEKLLATTPQLKSYSPKISVSFVANMKCEARHALRVKVVDIPKESMLAVSLIPEIDGIDAGANLAKPTLPAGYCELPGLPVVRKVNTPGGSWDICYPSFVFDRNTYLPPAPNSRRITGWIVRAYLVDNIAALPIIGGKNIGKLQTINTHELQDGLYLLGTEMESAMFSLANFKVIVIPQSDSGVFFYINEDALLISTKKKFNADVLGHNKQ